MNLELENYGVRRVSVVTNVQDKIQMCISDAHIYSISPAS